MYGALAHICETLSAKITTFYVRENRERGKIFMENERNYNLDGKKCKCVYSAPLARALIHKDYAVRDIKPNKDNRDKSVFVFEESEEFLKDMAMIIEDYAKKRISGRGDAAERREAGYRG